MQGACPTASMKAVCFWFLVADAVEIANCDSLQDQYNSLYERNKKLHENVQLCSDLVVEMRAGHEGEPGGARTCGGGAERELVDTVPHCDVSDNVEEVTV